MESGKIGVLGYIAYSESNIRHYYAMAFIFDLIDRAHSEMEILTTAEDFPQVKPKKDDLADVNYTENRSG